MKRYQVVRDAKNGGLAFAEANSLRELKALVVGTTNLRITDTAEGTFTLSQNVQYWGKLKNCHFASTHKLCKGILKASYAKVS